MTTTTQAERSTRLIRAAKLISTGIMQYSCCAITTHKNESSNNGTYTWPTRDFYADLMGFEGRNGLCNEYDWCTRWDTGDRETVRNERVIALLFAAAASLTEE